MVIGGERVSNVHFLHRGKADAIGKGPLFISVMLEPEDGRKKTVLAYPFDVERLASADRVQPIS